VVGPAACPLPRLAPFRRRVVRANVAHRFLDRLHSARGVPTVTFSLQLAPAFSGAVRPDEARIIEGTPRPRTTSQTVCPASVGPILPAPTFCDVPCARQCRLSRDSPLREFSSASAIQDLVQKSGLPPLPLRGLRVLLFLCASARGVSLHSSELVFFFSQEPTQLPALLLRVESVETSHWLGRAVPSSIAIG